MALLPPDPVYTLRCPDIGPVHSICFHSDERLFAATKKGQVHLFDLQTNRSTYHLNIGENSLNAIYHTEDYLVTLEKGGGLELRQLTNSGYMRVAECDLEHAGFCRFEVAPDQNFLFGPKNDSGISVMGLDSLDQRFCLLDVSRSDLGIVSSLKYLPLSSGDCLLAGYESGALLLWDLRKSTEPLTQQKLPNEFITSIDYDLINKRGIVGNSSDKMNIFGINLAQTEILVKGEIAIKNAGIHCVRIRSDRKVFTSGGWDGRIRIFSWKSLRPLAVLNDHKADVMDITYSTGKVSLWKSKIMAACGSDGTITLWDIYN